jgi:septal ring factor EnvC (AmiA/AmiB activator)
MTPEQLRTKIAQLEKDLAQEREVRSHEEGNFFSNIYEPQLAELGQEITQHLTEIQNLQATLANQTKSLETEQNKTKLLQNKLTTLRAEKNTNETNLQAQIQAKAAELEQEKQTGRTSTAQLRREIEDLRQQIATNQQTHHQALAEEQSKLQAAENKLQEQITANQT